MNKTKKPEAETKQAWACLLQIFNMSEETYSPVAIFESPQHAFNWARNHPLSGDALLCYTVLQLPNYAQEKEPTSDTPS